MLCFVLVLPRLDKEAGVHERITGICDMISTMELERPRVTPDSYSGNWPLRRHFRAGFPNTLRTKQSPCLLWLRNLLCLIVLKTKANRLWYFTLKAHQNLAPLPAIWLALCSIGTHIFRARILLAITCICQ